jgi:hypothetical protein
LIWSRPSGGFLFGVSSPAVRRRVAPARHDLEEAIALASLLCRSPTPVHAYVAFARCSPIIAAHYHALIAFRTLDGRDIDATVIAA